MTGKLTNGTPFELYVPTRWNGVLVLNPDLAPNLTAMGVRLHDLGYATANRARDITDWQVRQGATDLVQLKHLFVDQFGPPKLSILYGGSLGGLVTRDAGETYPGRFDGVIPTCGGGAGLIAMYNNRLDFAFALKTLLAPGDPAIDLTRVRDEKASTAALTAVIAQASVTPVGRARLALAAAIGQVQGWPNAAAAPPAASDYDTQIKAIAETANSALVLRGAVEAAAGGSYSWNVGVDYRAMFNQAGDESIALARALYRQAGADLEADLSALQNAPRITADPVALAWARENGTPSGKLKIPTLVLFTAADGRAPRSEYRAYQQTVEDAGAQALLRQLGVNSSGHCRFNQSEQAAAIELMTERLRTGKWPSTDPAAMNARGAALNAAAGGAMGAPRFTSFTDNARYPRRFTREQPLPAGALAPLAPPAKPPE